MSATDSEGGIRWPFPVDALPEPMRSLSIEGGSAIGCPPEMIALPALATAGAAIGTSRAVRIKAGHIEYPSLWCVLVSRSGSGKSPAQSLATRPLEDLQREAFAEHAQAMTDLAADDSLEKPECKRHVVIDLTVESIAPLLQANPRGLLAAPDELLGLVGSLNAYKGGKGGDVEAWLSIADSRAITVDRRTSSTLFVPTAFVGMCGSIQPEPFARAMGGSHVSNGFVGRFLVAEPPASVPPWSDQEVSNETLEGWSQCVRRLAELDLPIGDTGHPEPKLIGMDDEARSIYVRLFNELGDQAQAASDRLAPAITKLRPRAARLAMILHFVDRAHNRLRFSSPNQIEADTMTRAAELTRWFAHEAERVYGGTLSDEAADTAERLHGWLSKRGAEGATLTQIYKSGLTVFRGKRDRAIRDLRTLEREERIRRITPPPTGGRPAAERIVAIPDP